MKHTFFRSLLRSWRQGVLVLAVSAVGFFSPASSYAVTSGPGVWDFMIFGSYDISTVNNGAIFPNYPAGTSPTWSNALNNGYGGGIGVAYWFNDNIAFRLEAQTNLFTGAGAFSADNFQSSPLTGGFEVKLWGDPDWYLYAVVDAGVAYEGTLASGAGFFGKTSANAWSAYGDAGLGVNFDYVFVEVKVAYMPQALANPGLAQNGLWYIPVTAGFNF